MKRLFSIVLACVLGVLSVYAQESKPGIPPSFSWPQERQQLLFEIMTPVNTTKLLEEDMILDTIKDIPWRFGTPIYVELSPENSGTWYVDSNGDRVWRLGINSTGAYALTLIFDRFILPEGAELYLYNTDRSRVIGAFTNYNNQADHYFATTLIEGDELVIEYFEPQGVAFPGELKIESVNHAYRDPLSYLKAFGDAGWCNLNVACPQGEGWENQIRSVALMLASGTAWCSGALINNTANDGTPFLLTANHCYQNPGTLVFWFNWQSASCENPSSSPPYDAVGNLQHRSRNAESDFWLLEFSNPIPENVNPFFSGWNRELVEAIEDTIVGIHHPRGDIKKFSYAKEGVQASSYLGAPGSGTTHWRITWSGGTTTEGGSSGSPIFDAEGRILGQLHGGYAACGNTSPDYYGRLGISWTGGGTATSRLSDWLDPLGTGETAIKGFDPYGEVVDEVTDFIATPINSSTVQLSWNQNDNQHPVVLAYNTDNSFGTPDGDYFIGQNIPDGGTIIYIGDSESFLHENLDFATTYFYKVWSRSNAGNYSKGATAEATTPCPMIETLPFMEGFNEPTVPVCWEQIFEEGAPIWQTGIGNNSSIPASAYEGSHNAFIKAEEAADYGKATKLVSPVINFGDLELGEISFYYANAAKDELQDTLRVFYRLSPDSEWNLLGLFSDNVIDWTPAILELQELSTSFQIAFEGSLEGGHGITLDLVKISGYYNADFPAPQNLIAAISNESDVNLLWEAPTMTENSAVLQGYRIYRNGNPIANIADIAQLSFTDSGLAIGNYVYEVIAFYKDPIGESQPSNPAEITIEPAPTQFQLTIIVQGDGTTNPGVGTHTFNEGSNVTLTANPALSSNFIQWLENGEQLSAEDTLIISMNSDRVINAEFALKQYQVSLQSIPEGISVLSGQGTYDHGQTANISTTLPHGYNFLYWKEGENIFSSHPSFETVITSDRLFTAHFSLKQYEVNLEADPEAGGQVSGNGSFDFGTEVTVTAEPNEGYDFKGWYKNTQLVSAQQNYSFIIEEDTDLVARFSMKTFKVSLGVTPQGAGTVSGAGTYDYGATATVSVAVYSGNEFVGWHENENIISVENPFSFEVFENRTLTAVLEPSEKTLIIEVDGMGSTYPPPGAYTHSINSTVGITAVANPGWQFKEWDVNGQILEQAAIEVIMSEDITATARFENVVSVGDPDFQSGFKVYPQPARDWLILEWTSNTTSALIEVFSLGGQRMLSLSEKDIPKNNGRAKLNLSALQQGVYLIRFTASDIVFVQKIVIH